MDPTTALERLRAFTARALAEDTGADGDALEMAEQFEALDQWLTNGGFPPHQWGCRTPAGNDVYRTARQLNKGVAP